MSAVARSVVVFLFGVLASCATAEAPPLGQVLLVVTTDAPLPLPPSERAGADTPLALFDRVAIDIFAPGESTPCVECSRDLAIDAPMVNEGRLSFGVVTRTRTGGSGDGYRARVRIYRSRSAARSGATTVPRESSTLEAVVALPIVGAEGIVRKTLALHTDDVARPRGTLAEPAPLDDENAPRLKAATWPGARVLPCLGEAAEDEVCVPGGAYWMGGAGLLDLAGFGLSGATERLVVLSPFFVDRDEVTVGAFRASGLATMADPTRRGPAPDATECSYTATAGEFERHAVTCIRWSTAQSYCEKQGRRLPTEAELELLAGGRRGTRFVWGEDEPSCEDVVYARAAQSALSGGRECIDLGIGPAPIRGGARDVLSIGDKPIFDLAGGVSEWMADAWSPDNGACWPNGVLYDPLCTPEVAGTGSARSYRGGSYPSSAGLLRAPVRQQVPDVDRYVLPSVGFRCGRAAR